MLGTRARSPEFVERLPVLVYLFRDMQMFATNGRVFARTENVSLVAALNRLAVKKTVADPISGLCDHEGRKRGNAGVLTTVRLYRERRFFNEVSDNRPPFFEIMGRGSIYLDQIRPEAREKIIKAD